MPRQRRTGAWPRGSWPRALLSPRAEAMGFARDQGIDEVIRAFIEDDLALQRQLAG